MSRSANAVMFVIALPRSVVGGGCDDGPSVVVRGGISSVRVGFAGSSLERFLWSGASFVLGMTSLRGRDIARPMVVRSSLLLGYVCAGGCVPRRLGNPNTGGEI